jgi:hypothetical protein
LLRREKGLCEEHLCVRLNAPVLVCLPIAVLERVRDRTSAIVILIRRQQMLDSRSKPSLIVSATGEPVADSARRKPQARSARRRLLFLAMYCVYLVGLGWLAVRGYYWIRYDVGVVSHQLTTDELWRIHFPKLHTSGVESKPLGRDDGHFDVLLLGASVMEQVADRLESQLRDEMGDRLRVYNLCTAAHTTRDSYWKFTRLAEKDFDLIVVYHGINDARMNCCRPNEFREDYTHCGHYAAIQKQLVGGDVTVTELALQEFGRLIPLGSPKPEMLEFGRTIKTANAFRTNVESIVRAAQSRQRPVLLMTFAYHLPANYSHAKFQQHELDYGEGQYEMEAEVWGRPEYLRATIDAHNREIRRLASEYKNVILIDQLDLMPSEGRYFSDPCHLTDEGCRRFVTNMLPGIQRAAGLLVADSPSSQTGHPDSSANN